MAHRCVLESQRALELAHGDWTPQLRGSSPAQSTDHCASEIGGALRFLAKHEQSQALSITIQSASIAQS
jgi:hypothetical protein